MYVVSGKLRPDIHLRPSGKSSVACVVDECVSFGSYTMWYYTVESLEPGTFYEVICPGSPRKLGSFTTFRENISPVFISVSCDGQDLYGPQGSTDMWQHIVDHTEPANSVVVHCGDNVYLDRVLVDIFARAGYSHAVEDYDTDTIDRCVADDRTRSPATNAPPGGADTTQTPAGPGKDTHMVTCTSPVNWL